MPHKHPLVLRSVRIQCRPESPFIGLDVYHRKPPREPRYANERRAGPASKETDRWRLWLQAFHA